MVTNKRILSVIKLRPIDHLVCILKSMASASAEFYSLDIFDQFANKFSVEEVLSMLVQVLAEFKHGTYLYSQLVERSLIEFRQF